MAKKRVKRKRSVSKSPKGFFDRILESLFESLEENTEDVIEKLGDIAFLKSTLKRHFVFFIFTSASLVIFFYGLGIVINNYLPQIDIGLIYLGLGFILFIIGIISKKV